MSAKKTPKTAKTVDPLTALTRVSRSDKLAFGEALAVAREAGIPFESKTSPSIASALSVGSVIPLRVPLRAFLLSDPKANAKRFPREFAKVAPLAKTDAAIVAARDERGEGIPLIAARTGLTEKDVIAA